jgi:hypothetical protein
LVERLGFERAYEDPLIRTRLSDTARQQVEELLTRARAVANAVIAVSVRNEVNELAVLIAEGTRIAGAIAPSPGRG